MTDDRKSGIAFLASSVGGLLTMAIHPVAHHVMTPEEAARLSALSGIAHSLAMISLVIMFLGAAGLIRRIGASDRLAFAGTAVFGVAVVAGLIATGIDGFALPTVMRHMARDIPDEVPQWNIVIDALFQIIQAFAKVYSVAASISLALWSLSAIRNGGLYRGIAIYGCIVAPFIVLVIATGHLRLNVHGMAVAVFAHAIWFLMVGTQLCRHRDATIAA